MWTFNYWTESVEIVNFYNTFIGRTCRLRYRYFGYYNIITTDMIKNSHEYDVSMGISLYWNQRKFISSSAFGF